MRRQVAVLGWVVLLGCARSEPAEEASVEAAAVPTATAAEVKQVIEQANARFLDALKKNDVATAVENYTEDAIIMMPNAPAWRGKAGITEGLRGFTTELALQQATMTTDDVIVAGDLAIETGSGEWTLKPKTGAAITDKVKYMTVWRKQPDGSWKIIRDINNSDLPASH